MAADPRVTISDGIWSCQQQTLDLGNYCANMPQLFLSSNMCGKSGPTGAGLSIAKLTPAAALEQNVNNTLTTFIVSPSVTLPAGSNPNPNCGDPNGPIVAWGPLPGVESNIPEGNTLIDITVACVPDPPPAGKGNHPSVVVQGAALVSLTAAYVGGEFANLQAAFTQLINAGQIVDNTNIGVVSTIQFYITQSQAYFSAGSYSCALNSLWNGVQYVNALVNAPATAGDFVAGIPPAADQNPSGTLVMRFDHLYYDVNVIAGNAPITTDALSLPATSVPACAGAASVTIPPFSPAQTVSMLIGQRGLFTGRITPPQSCSTSTWTVVGSSVNLAAGPSYGLVDASASSVSTLTLTEALMSGNQISTSLQIAVIGDLWFWSSSSAEIDALIANTNGAYAIDGPVYDVATTNIDPSTNAVNPNLIPLYRYLNASTHTHFWTAYPSGELLTGWTLEGQTGWVFNVATDGAQPVYRFYNPTTNVHFWTFDSNAEGQLSNGFQLEGIVFYARPGGTATDMTPMIRARCTLCVTPPETQFPIANLPPNPTACPSP